MANSVILDRPVLQGTAESRFTLIALTDLPEIFRLNMERNKN